jgi:hypothetical protein
MIAGADTELTAEFNATKQSFAQTNLLAIKKSIGNAGFSWRNAPAMSGCTPSPARATTDRLCRLRLHGVAEFGEVAGKTQCCRAGVR